MMEALARHGFNAEAFSGLQLELPGDVDPESHLASRGFLLNALGGESWSTDPRGFWASTPPHYLATVRGLPVTLYRGSPTASLDDDIEQASFLRLYSATLDRFRPDVVVNYGGDHLAHEMRRLARAAGAVVVFALHNFNYPDASAFSTADSVIVPSRFAADHYRSTLGLECTVLPNLISLDRVRAANRDPRYVTFVNPCPAKGVHVFARIADELGRKRPDIPFLVVESRGSERTLADCGLDLKQHGNVFLMGHTPDPRDFWGVTRLCVVPSLWQESECLVAVEAMINGIPVLAGMRGALPETLGGAGVLLPLPERLTSDTRELPSPQEVWPWIEAIERAWDDPDWYAELARRSVAESRRRAPEILERRYVEFFTKLGSPERNGPRATV